MSYFYDFFLINFRNCYVYMKSLFIWKYIKFKNIILTKE